MAKHNLTNINGVIIINSIPFEDSRGSFLNLFRASEEIFLETWGKAKIAQVNLSKTKEVGSIRGLHFQSEPHSESKLVRCIKGKVYDVAVDLRIDSKTFKKWHAEELSPNKGNALLIPNGCAHGFQVLEPNSEILYLHSGNWVPEAETGVRWDDPQIAVNWPLPISNISKRDRCLPFLFQP